MLTQVPRRVVERPYKLAYQKSPLKNVFGSDGVDKFDGDDNEDEDHNHEGPSMKARYVIHEHLLSSFLIPLRVPVVLVPSSDVEVMDEDQDKSDFENKNPQFYDE